MRKRCAWLLAYKEKKERIKFESQNHGYKPGKFSIRIVKKDLDHRKRSMTKLTKEQQTVLSAKKRKAYQNTVEPPLMATSLQRLLSSDPKVVFVERFDCIINVYDFFAKHVGS